MYSINKNKTPSEEIRYAIINKIESLLLHDSTILILDADLMSASGTVSLLKSNPDSTFNLGAMEANMVGIAGGLSQTGFKPFIHTFSPFFARKCIDQLFLAGTYAKNPMTLLASDPGLCAQVNGGTHTSLEDIGTLNSFSRVKIYDVCDSVQAKWVIEDRVKCHEDVGYIRYPRRPLKEIYTDSSIFRYGEAPIINEGSDVGIFASGIMLSIALDVANNLIEQGISVRIIDCFSLSKPDIQEIVKTAEKCTHLFSLDNHNINTGLGSIITNILGDYCPRILTRIGVYDYGQVGSLEELLRSYGLDSNSITQKVKDKLLRS